MPPRSSRRLPASARALALTAAILSALAITQSPKTAAAQGFDDSWQPEHLEAYGDSFNGTFTAIEARYGLTQVGGNDYSGYSLDAGLRMAFPMYVGDMRLGYRFDDLSHDGKAPDPGQISTHSLIASLALHPLYLVLLGNDWLSYTIASLYVDLGLGAQLSWRDMKSPVSGDGFDAGFAWHLGAGIDIPLWDADLGQAPWLNLLYRYQRADFDLDDERALDLHTHTLFVGLSWRFNRLLF